MIGDEREQRGNQGWIEEQGEGERIIHDERGACISWMALELPGKNDAPICGASRPKSAKSYLLS